MRFPKTCTLCVNAFGQNRIAQIAYFIVNYIFHAWCLYFRAAVASAPVSPTYSQPPVRPNPTQYEQQDSGYAFPDYRVGSGYQGDSGPNDTSGYSTLQHSSPYDMRQFEQTPPISGYSTMPVRSVNKQSNDGFRPVQPAQQPPLQQPQQQQNKYPYKSTSGIQLQLQPQTQSQPREDEYNQRPYNDRGSYSQPMSPVQYMNGNRTDSPYQRQTSVGQNRPDPNPNYQQSHFKKPTPFSPGYVDNSGTPPSQPRLQRQTSSGNQAPPNVYESTISPGYRSGNYHSDDAPPPPPPPTNYTPEPYGRPYEPDTGRSPYGRQLSNQQQNNYGSSTYEQQQNNYNAYQSQQPPSMDNYNQGYQRQGSRPYEPQAPQTPSFHQMQRQPSNPNQYDDRRNQVISPTRVQNQDSYGFNQPSTPQGYTSSPQQYSRQPSHEQQQFSRQSSRDQSRPMSRQQSQEQSHPMSRQHSRDQHIEPPSYSHPISPPGNAINSFDDILSPFENFQNSNYCDKLFSRSPDPRADIDSGVSMSSDTPRSNQSASYSPPHSYQQSGYDNGLLRPAPQAPPPPPVTPPPPPPPPPPSNWTPPTQEQLQAPRRKLLPPEVTTACATCAASDTAYFLKCSLIVAANTY